MKRSSIRRALIAAVVALAMTAPLPSRAAPGGFVVTSGNFYSPGDDRPQRGVTAVPIVIVSGTELYHMNWDLDAHNIQSDAVDEHGARLFDGPPLNDNELAPVPGVESLPAGEYGFHCRYHDDMQGTLIIL